jgi:hypothetical protein
MRLAAIATGSDRSNRHNFEIRSDAPIRSLPQQDQSGSLECRAVARLEPVSPASPAARIGPIRLRDQLLTRARQPGLRTLLHDWLRNSPVLKRRHSHGPAQAKVRLTAWDRPTGPEPFRMCHICRTQNVFARRAVSPHSGRSPRVDAAACLRGIFSKLLIFF